MRSLQRKLLGKIEGLAHDHGFEAIEVNPVSSNVGLLWLQPRRGYRHGEQDLPGSGEPREYFGTVLSIGYDFQTSALFISVAPGGVSEFDRPAQRFEFQNGFSEAILLWLMNLNRQLREIKEREQRELND